MQYSRTAQVLLVITSVVTIATTRFVYKASTGLIASGTTHEHAYLCSLHSTTDAWSSVLRHVKYCSNYIPLPWTVCFTRSLSVSR